MTNNHGGKRKGAGLRPARGVAKTTNQGDTKMTRVTISYANVELAVKNEHGAWELLGDFATLESAKNAAKEYAELGQYHIDDHGVMVFGISEDPASGQYEISYSVEVGK